jgi:glycosyltransferase involved in cell wall biosynthesis
MARSTSKGQLSDRLNLLLRGLPSVGSVFSGWGEQKVENLAVPATSEVLKVDQSDVDLADHNLGEMPKEENKWQQDEIGDVNLFLNKINKSYLKNLVIENEKYVESYSRILKKVANRCLKVMVGTLYSGESEFNLCTASVNRQTYRNCKHIVINNLPNIEAHNTLYETFLNSEFDILIKLDADMVLIDDEFFDKVVNLVLFSKGLAIIQIAILDFYTGRAIQGINVYTKLFKWNCQFSDNVFTDRSKVKFENRMLVWNKFQRSVIHSPNPSNFQAFHFGIHRAIKVIEANQRGDMDSAVEQYVYLEKTHEHYLLRKTNNLLMASIGSQIGLSGIFTHEAIDYTNDLLKTYYQKLIKEESDLHGFLMELRRKFATQLNLESVRGIAEQHLQEKRIKRVSFLLPHLQTFGGVFRFLELARELGRNGIEAVISVIDEGMSEQDIDQVKQSFDNIKISKLSQSILEDWDVVVCGDFSSGLFLTLPYFKTRITCAYLLNGWQHRYINIEQINLAKPELVVANSSYCAKHYQDLAPVIIPGGINLITFQLNNYDVKKKLSIVKIFVPVGRRKPRKRFDDALVACRDLSNKYQIELHTVDTHELPNFSAGNLSHIHHQNLTREKIANLLNQMDIAILPEEDAGWNNCAAEALAVGCPVICTEAGTIDFAIDNETVLLVTPRNPIEIYNAAIRLIESYELRLKLSTNGRKHIKQFSWYSVARNLLNLFYESMKASESRPDYLPIVRRNIENLFAERK